MKTSWSFLFLISVFLPMPQESNVLTALLCPSAGEPRSVTSLKQSAFLVETADGDFVLRFSADEDQLAGLRKEERIAVGLRGWISLRQPDTQVLPAWRAAHLSPSTAWTLTTAKPDREIGG